jgi:hypothetical protein
MRCGCDAGGVLKHPGEAVGGALGAAPVEPEDELVEIALQVLGADGAVVRAQQPTLGEAKDEMEGGQALVGLASGAREVDGVVVVVGGFEPTIATPTVGGDRGALGDVGGDEAREAVASAAGADLERFIVSDADAP